MERKLSQRIEQLKDALANFEKSLTIDQKPFNDNIVDSIKSGRVQKFKFCVELLWKTMKVYLWEVNIQLCGENHDRNFVITAMRRPFIVSRAKTKHESRLKRCTLDLHIKIQTQFGCVHAE